MLLYLYIIDIYTYTVTELRYRLPPLIVAQGVCSWHDPWHGLEVSSLGQETLQQHLRVSFCMMSSFFCFVYFELKTLPQKAHFFFKNKAAGKFNTARLLKNPCNRVLRSSKRHPTITYRSFQKSTSKQPKKPIFCRDEQENQQKKTPRGPKNPPDPIAPPSLNPCIPWYISGRHVHRAWACHRLQRGVGMPNVLFLGLWRVGPTRPTNRGDPKSQKGWGTVRNELWRWFEVWDKFRLFSFWMVGCVLVEHAKFENERIVGCHWPNLKLKYIYIYICLQVSRHIFWYF